MKRNSIVLFVFVIVSSALYGDVPEIKDYWNTGLKDFRREGFIKPDVCGQCHDEIYDMWNGSMHSNAIIDPLFVAASKLLLKGVENSGEREDAEHCVACHNPIAYRSGQIKGSSDDYSNVDDVTRHSISCDMCHTVDEIVKLRNASFNTDPGNGEDDPGVKRGPHDQVESMFHDSKYSKIHTSSEICGTCHNVTHLWYITRLEGTYDEWYHSPYNSLDPEEKVTCQNCHMRQSLGKPSTGMTQRPDYPGTSASMGEERPHIYRHYVVGANTLLPELLDHPVHGQLAHERLEHAAEIEILSAGTGKKVDSITVRVKNKGAGHMLPTGVTEFRQMWIELTVKDKKGKTVFFSGGVKDDGSLSDDTRIFQTVFGDSEGNPTINVAKASRILYDHRIQPKGYIDEFYGLGKAYDKPLTVHAELKYRSMVPSLVSILLEKSEVSVPVVVMTVSESKIE